MKILNGIIRKHKIASLLITLPIILSVLLTQFVSASMVLPTTSNKQANYTWLGTWANRIMIQVDYSKIDSTLTNFPVMIHLCTSSGLSQTDLTTIFTALSSDANRTKIAVTTSDGTTQCYVEIESWNTISHDAVLWVKVPTINFNSDTILYLYYDSTQPANTTYVGDVGSTPAKMVWNTTYTGVFHLNGSYNGTPGEVKDSTINANHGTAGGMGGYPTQVDSVIGSGQDFDGNTGTTGGHRPYISIPDSNGYSIPTTNKLAITLWFQPTATAFYDTTGGDMDYINAIGKGSGGSQTEWEWGVGGSNSPNKPYEIFYYAQSLAGGSGNGVGTVPGHGWTVGNKIFCVVTFDLTNDLMTGITYYPDGTIETSTNHFTGLTIANGTAPLMIGTSWASNPDQALKSTIDELEISNVVLTDAWIKASYYAQLDKLLYYGSGSGTFQRRYEFFINDTGNTNGGGGVYWRGQTFTPTTSHYLQAVKLKLNLNTTAAGNFTVSIRATSGGLPTGPDLGSGSIPVSSIPNNYSVVTIQMSTNVPVNTGTQYAIVWRATSLIAAGNITIREKDPSTDYVGGAMVDSSNSGSTWSNNPTYDIYFEEWGIPLTTLPVVSTSSLPNGTVGVAYSQTLAVTGGTTPYTWSISSGTLPAGLSLSSSGIISGTPTTAGGPTSITFKVTDSTSATATKVLSITINSTTLSITTSSLPNGTIGVAYSQTLAATGGTTPYTWSIAAGTLPAGLSLNSNGVISGTPTTAGGPTSITFRVTDSASATATKGLSITVGYAAWDVNSDGAVNVLDIILISQHFGETGTPGWIREDVNNDGVINVLDTILVGQHLS